MARLSLRVRLDGSALYTATSYGHEMVVGVLVEKGADVNQANKNGVTPLMAAAMEGRCATEPFVAAPMDRHLGFVTLASAQDGGGPEAAGGGRRPQGGGRV